MWTPSCHLRSKDMILWLNKQSWATAKTKSQIPCAQLHHDLGSQSRFESSCQGTILKWHYCLAHLDIKRVQFLLWTGVLAHTESVWRIQAAAGLMSDVADPTLWALAVDRMPCTFTTTCQAQAQVYLCMTSFPVPVGPSPSWLIVMFGDALSMSLTRQSKMERSYHVGDPVQQDRSMLV